jgi:hypothetical protein
MRSSVMSDWENTKSRGLLVPDDVSENLDEHESMGESCIGAVI